MPRQVDKSRPYSKGNIIRTIAVGDDNWREFKKHKKLGMTDNDVLKILLNQKDIRRLAGK